MPKRRIYRLRQERNVPSSYNTISEKHSSLKMLKLYGVPVSQPVRAVAWALALKQVPFQMCMVGPGGKGKTGTRHENFRNLSPAGTVPIIDDGGYVLGESNAILTYLANKLSWSDLYPPPSNPKCRGGVDWYLHWHHANIRPMTKSVFVKYVRPDIFTNEIFEKEAAKKFSGAMQLFNDALLEQNKYLVSEDFTLADLVAYSEVGQYNSTYSNLYDFSPYPNVQRWMDRMGDVPFHDEVHEANKSLGDLTRSEAVEMKAIVQANKDWVKTMLSVSKMTM
jgi:glutathione S-transferase